MRENMLFCSGWYIRMDSKMILSFSLQKYKPTSVSHAARKALKGWTYEILEIWSSKDSAKSSCKALLEPIERAARVESYGFKFLSCIVFNCRNTKRIKDTESHTSQSKWKLRRQSIKIRPWDSFCSKWVKQLLNMIVYFNTGTSYHFHAITETSVTDNCFD